MFFRNRWSRTHQTGCHRGVLAVLRSHTIYDVITVLDSDKNPAGGTGVPSSLFFAYARRH